MNGDGGQGEAVRVPLADGTLVAVPGSGHSDDMLRSLLTLSDVMGTGHHAAVCASVEAGDDGRRRRRRRRRPLRRARRQAPRRRADHRPEPPRRPPGARPRVRRHRHRRRARRGGGREGQGDDRRRRRRRHAGVRRHRPGDGDGARRSRAPARWSATSASPTASSCRCEQMFFRNVGVQRRPRAGARLHPRAARRRPGGRINPGRVLDYETDLDGIADAYAAMDERRAIKSLVRVGTL